MEFYRAIKMEYTRLWVHFMKKKIVQKLPDTVGFCLCEI